MYCPKCAFKDTKVIETRVANEQTIRRRRQCLSCSYRFTTLETLFKDELLVVKRDGRREPFQREKLEAGVFKAVEKCAIEQSTLEDILQEIVDQLHKNYDLEVPSSIIGERVMECLKNLNPIAYVRFASVCKAFQDVSDFAQELRAIKQ